MKAQTLKTIWDFTLMDESATMDAGQRLSAHLYPGLVVFLDGPIGAGKTTLVRGLLRGLGYTGHVRSPTYTLVESYAIGDWIVHHFDLYRLGDPEELEWMGIRDYLDTYSVCLFEWPEKGSGWLPEMDWRIELKVEGTGRRILWQTTDT